MAIVRGSPERNSSYKNVYGYEWAELDDHSANVSLFRGDQKYQYRLESLSEGIIQNSVLAVVTALEMNVDSGQIIEGIESWKPVRGRGTIIPLSTIKKDLFIKIATMRIPHPCLIL